MKFSEAALATFLGFAGCHKSADFPSGNAACDSARQEIKKLKADEVPSETDSCEELTLQRNTVRQAIHACNGAPPFHLALLHIERQLTETRPDCLVE
jgi:hypothetical protein